MTSENITLHFKGAETDTDRIPASLLISTLTNFEDLFYLIAREEEGISFASRLSISEDIKKKYGFFCEVPQKGCYALPLSLECPEKDSLFKELNAAQKFRELFTGKDIKRSINDFFTTAPARYKALSLMQTALPSSNSNYSLEISYRDTTRNCADLQKEVEVLLRETKILNQNVPNFSIVSGYLQKIDLKKSWIELSYPPTKRSFKCYYQTDEIADTILKFAAEDKKRLLKISGDLSLDKNDEPSEMSNISSIDIVDLTPIVLKSFTRNSREFSFENPLVLNPHLDDSEQLYILVYPEIGLDIAVFTREELEDEIETHIEFLWDEYAREDDKNLTDSAIKLKRNILSILSVKNI